MAGRENALQRQIDKLLTRFRRQRPLRGGSLIVTVFGDALAPRGATISLGSLIRLTEPFGLTDRLVRTSVTRLADDGWLEAERHGRQSDYRLTEHGRTRFADATVRIYGEGPASWDGRWTLVVLPHGAGNIRAQAREELKWLGFGELAPGVLAHPARDAKQVREQLAELRLLDEVILIEGTTGSLSFQGPENAQLAVAAWDLDEIAHGYKRFIAMFEPLRALTTRTGELPPQTAFIVRTLLIHEYRKIHLRDPLLPRNLLPVDWVGAQAYELCRALYAQVFSAAELHLSGTVQTCKGSLPAPERATFARFGGLPSSGGRSQTKD